MADPERSKFLLEFYGPAVTTIIEVLYTCAVYMVNVHVCVHVHETYSDKEDLSLQVEDRGLQRIQASRSHS